MTRRNPSPTSLEMIAERLILTREAMKVDQAEFCRLVGITTAAWNNYERQVRRISIDQAHKVCDGTGATLDWIYRGQTVGLPRELAIAIQKLRAKRPRDREKFLLVQDRPSKDDPHGPPTPSLKPQ